MVVEEFDKIISNIKMDFLLNNNREIFGLILSRMNVYIDYTPSEDSFAYTDGSDIYFFVNWIDKLSLGNIEFILCHEILHLILNHLTRQEDRNSLLFNIASDYCVNSLLCENSNDKALDPIGLIPEGALYDKKYSNLSAEEIYDLLKDDFKEKSSFRVMKGQLSEDDTNKLKDKGYRVEYSNDITVIDYREHKTDDHQSHEVSEDKQRDFLIEFSEDIIKCATKSSENSFLRKALSKIKRVKYNWKRIIKKYIKSTIKCNSTWRRPSKRGLSLQTYLPSISKKDEIKIAVAIDVSGSINDIQLQKLMSFLYECFYQLPDFKVWVWLFSGIVHDSTFKVFTKKNIEDIHNIKYVSNGSTDIKSNFSFVLRNKDMKKLDLFIVMTDGYDSINDLEYKNPLLWCIIDNERFINPSGCTNAKIINLPQNI